MGACRCASRLGKSRWTWALGYGKAMRWINGPTKHKGTGTNPDALVAAGPYLTSPHLTAWRRVLPGGK
jgi:hypothetical protein